MNKIKKTILIITCILLTISATAVTKTISVSAANVKNKTITLKVGEKYILTPSGIGRVKKWVSSKKKVATISKGTVKAVSSGTTKITAIGTNGKVSCKIAVKDTKKSLKKAETTKSKYIKNIEVTTSMLDDSSVICTIKNNNSVKMKEVKVQLKLYDNENAVLGTDTLEFFNVAKGATQYKKVVIYLDGNQKNKFDPSKTETVVDVSDNAIYKNFMNPNKFLESSEYDQLGNKTVLTFNNNTSKKVYIDCYVEYRDAEGKLVGVSWVYEWVEAGSKAFRTVYDPINVDGKQVPYTSTTIVGQAYTG